MPKHRPHPASILYLCTHNAGRSQMAAGWTRFLGGPAVTVYSGGSEPGESLNAMAVAAMAEVGIDIADHQPQRWSIDQVESADAIISMGCGDTCPVLPGKRYEDWDLVDPHGGDIDLVRTVRDEIERRVRLLLGELGVDALE